MSPSDITNKLWNYCNVLRDDGMSYGDYVEQLTYLLFLKMADERAQAPYNQPSIVPQQYSWSSLIKKDGDALFDQFSGSRCPALARKPGLRLLPRAFGGSEVHWTSLHFRLTHHALDALGKEKGLLGLIFNKAQNKFQDPAKLRRLLVELIDKENWSVMSADVKGDAYEGLLEKNAQDTKSSAGQYFTPRALIQAMVDVMAPEPGETIADPACGTGGFLLAAHQYLVDNYPNMTKPQKKALKAETFKGWELVQSTARLCAMTNRQDGRFGRTQCARRAEVHGCADDSMLLHGIGDQEYEPIVVGDSLAADPGDRFDLILANPPFGKKSGTTIVGEQGRVTKERDTVERDDFWATTSNKQLNFVQHIKTLLKVNGSAAVVVPDNVLFEGGAGETIRRKLLHECEVHTLLRLPTGLFYAQGVKANVLFFDKKAASETPWTRKLWIYDLRTNMHFTLKTNPLKREDLDDFVQCYVPEARHLRSPTWTDEKPPHPSPLPGGEGTKEKGAVKGLPLPNPLPNPLPGGEGTGFEGRWRSYDYEELINRDKASLDIFWLKDESLEESDNLPEPGFIAAEIVEDLEAALEQFRAIAEDLGEGEVAEA